MVKLMNPEMKEVETLNKADFDGYLRKHSKKAIKANIRDAYVVYDENMDHYLAEFEAKNMPIIRNYTRAPDFVLQLKEFLSKGELVAFAPSQKSMRHFYSIEGFIKTISEAVSEISEAEIVVPPGYYGKYYLAIVKRK